MLSAGATLLRSLCDCHSERSEESLVCLRRRWLGKEFCGRNLPREVGVGTPFQGSGGPESHGILRLRNWFAFANQLLRSG